MPAEKLGGQAFNREAMRLTGRVGLSEGGRASYREAWSPIGRQDLSQGGQDPHPPTVSPLGYFFPRHFWIIWVVRYAREGRLKIDKFYVRGLI